MTYPVSAVEAIEKAMREAAVNLVDTLVLERETNGQSKEFSDWAVFMVMRAFKEQRADAARQAEALQRENAELREALKPFAAHQTADGLSGPGSLLYIPNDHPILFNGLGNDVRVSVTVGHIRRARALLGGSDAGN